MNKIKYAKYAGILYLLIAIISPIALIYVPSQMISNNNAIETIQSISNNETLFRVGIGIETLVCLSEIALTVILYKLFKEVNVISSKIAFVSRLSMTIIQSINIIASLTVIELLTSTPSGNANISYIAYAFLEYKTLGVQIWQIFFVLHLITLGYTVYKSNYVSKYFGILLAISCLGYLSHSYFNIFALNAPVFGAITSILLVFSTLGEVAFMLRLLIKKINLPN